MTVQAVHASCKDGSIPYDLDHHGWKIIDLNRVRHVPIVQKWALAKEKRTGQSPFFPEVPSAPSPTPLPKPGNVDFGASQPPPKESLKVDAIKVLRDSIPYEEKLFLVARKRAKHYADRGRRLLEREQYEAAAELFLMAIEEFSL